MDKKQITDELVDNAKNLIEDEEKNISIFDAVSKALENFDGKKITRRMETAVKNALSDYTVYYEKEYGMYRLFIWGKDIDYNRRLSVLLGYDETFCYYKFKNEHNTCYTEGAPKRLAEAKSFIANPEKIDRIAETIIAYKKSQEEIRRVSDEIPGFYDVKEKLQIKIAY